MLPDGVDLHSLTPHRDARGVFTELHRSSWPGVPALAQWNAVRSEAGVLRGMHVHVRHTDYLTLALGHAVIGLHDIRPESPTFGAGASLALDAQEPAAIVIPAGVAHGFCFTEVSLHVYAMTHEWSPADDLGCRFDDPELGLEWPVPSPLLSERDERLGSLSELRRGWIEATTLATA